jgi:lipoate-protein ligase A
MEENLTTMKRELGEAPPRQEICQTLTSEFEKVLGRLEPVDLDATAVAKMAELEKWFTSPQFLHKKRPKVAAGVKIRGGVEILYGLHKAKGGLIRTAEEVEQERINSISISGDFNFYPKESLDKLESDLEKTEFKSNPLIEKLDRFYEQYRVESPGVTSDDFKKTILEAKKA